MFPISSRLKATEAINEEIQFIHGFFFHSLDVGFPTTCVKATLNSKAKNYNFSLGILGFGHLNTKSSETFEQHDLENLLTL